MLWHGGGRAAAHHALCWEPPFLPSATSCVNDGKSGWLEWTPQSAQPPRRHWGPAFRSHSRNGGATVERVLGSHRRCSTRCIRCQNHRPRRLNSPLRFPATASDQSIGAARMVSATPVCARLPAAASPESQAGVQQDRGSPRLACSQVGWHPPCRGGRRRPSASRRSWWVAGAAKSPQGRRQSRGELAWQGCACHPAPAPHHPRPGRPALPPHAQAEISLDPPADCSAGSQCRACTTIWCRGGAGAACTHGRANRPRSPRTLCVV